MQSLKQPDAIRAVRQGVIDKTGWVVGCQNTDYGCFGCGKCGFRHALVTKAPKNQSILGSQISTKPGRLVGLTQLIITNNRSIHQ